jgi:hypothetical protein
MSYQNLINSSVDVAFSSAGDLAFEAVLANSSAEKYNFPVVDGFGNLTSGATTTSSIIETKVKVILEETKLETNKEGVTVTQKYLLAKSIDIADPSVYDTLTFDSTTHTIVSYTKDVALVQLIVTEV